MNLNGSWNSGLLSWVSLVGSDISGFEEENPPSGPPKLVFGGGDLSPIFTGVGWAGFRVGPDDLGGWWLKLSLTEMEGAECALKDGVIDESFAVVAKFFTKRKVNLEAVARTFRSALKVDGDFEFRDLGNNRAFIVFSDEVDMNIVLIQSPWSFDKYLMALHSRHMTKENGILIGNTLGEVITVDVPECGRAWSTCLLVWVKIDVTQPLCRGKMVRLGESDRRWVSFRYERLLIYCHWCGKLTHDEKDYRLWIQSNGSLSQDSQQYGPWLRAGPDRLQKPQVVKVGTHGPQQSLYGAAYTTVAQSMVVQS
ncbi:hypothetical protein SO802_034274 [Lithocarpus litseifolius]|uniref:DUF4283 domain-containing protein n=1 Tax=Lithocarpus litseifolius TaxID=425828 RepID=A0AAW2BIE9_9ROSI